MPQATREPRLRGRHAALLAWMLRGVSLRRVQERVDRRSNRARYDAARVVDGFRVRLRDEVNLDDLTGDLLAVVTATVRPAGTSLWLREVER